MEKIRLEKLKMHLDAAIQLATPEAMADLEQQLEIAYQEIQSSRFLSTPDSAEVSALLQIIQDLWYTAAAPPAALPGNLQQQASLASLLATMLASQRFALALSQGDLSQSLDAHGMMAGSLKSLQANLRHLTWQADQLARGDFSQRVDFMGEFSHSFNSMVNSLANALAQIREQNEVLAQINLSLKEEIAGRRQVEEENRQASARAEIQRRLIEQREQERVQIARDLHDGPLQELIALSFTIGNMIAACQDASLLEQLRSTKENIRELMTELRQFAGELRPPTLSRFGLQTTLQAHIDSVSQKHPELQIQPSLAINNSLLSETTQLALFRIFQEVLNNIFKHAKASTVQIKVRTGQGLAEMSVEDNGQGFVLPENWLDLALHGHLGLVGIRERAEAIGGQVKIWSQPGQGTKILVSVPLLPPHDQPIS